jgi:hypothetical protein
LTDIAKAKPPTVETHDPLPESNWLWRRVFIFAVTTVTVIGIWMMVQAMINQAGVQPPLIVGAFVKIIGWLLLLVWFLATYYMIAPTGEQIVKMWQSVTAWKSGIGTTVSQIARGADGSTATATTTTGPVVVPPGAQTMRGGASDVTGLPDKASEYAGPPIDHIPDPHPGTPENAPWQT